MQDETSMLSTYDPANPQECEVCGGDAYFRGCDMLDNTKTFACDCGELRLTKPDEQS